MIGEIREVMDINATNNSPVAKVHTVPSVVKIEKEDEAIIKAFNRPEATKDRLKIKYPNQNTRELFISALRRDEQTTPLALAVEKLHKVEMSDIFSLICDENSEFRSRTESSALHYMLLDDASKYGMDIPITELYGDINLPKLIEVNRKKDTHQDKLDISLLLKEYAEIADKLVGSNPYQYIEDTLAKPVPVMAPAVKEVVHTPEVITKKESLFSKMLAKLPKKIEMPKLYINKKASHDLWWAARSGDTKKAKKLVKKIGIDINYENDTNAPILMNACISGYTYIAKILLENGAKVNLQNRWGETALMEASEKGHANIVNLLLDHGADINLRNNDGLNALMLASREGHTYVVKTLIKHGAKVDNISEYGSSAFRLAASNNNPELLQILLDAGSEINLQDNYGETALMRACIGGNLNSVKFLVENGADAFIKDNNGRTAFNRAKDEIINYLRPIKEKRQRTIYLLEAIEKNNIDWARTTIEKGIDFGYQTKSGKTVLDMAKKFNRHEIANMIEKEIINNKEIAQEHAKKEQLEKVACATRELFIGAMANNLERIESAIKNGAVINNKDKDGNTPLSVASREGNAKAVAVLIGNGADISIKNNEGNTALMRAEFWEHDEVIKIISDSIKANNNQLSHDVVINMQLTNAMQKENA